MLTLIEGGDLYTPEHIGRQSILLVDGKIGRIGEIDRAAVHLSEIVRAGITTVVGTLGVDTTMKTTAGLLAKAKALKEKGITAHIWTGGYNVPTASIMKSVREDTMFIDEVIGAGEVALVTRNTAEVLKLERKGRLEVGADGDMLVLEGNDFELVHVLAHSTRMVTAGQVVVREQFLEKSNRRIALRGGEELDLAGLADINANQEPLEVGSPA